jgi:hypothetical protein
MNDRFNVRVQVELNKLAPDRRGFTGERLSINETVELGAKDWAEVCQILGQFHALAEKLDQ